MAILDQGWEELRRPILHKQVWKGGIVILVDPVYTSQECSCCGHVSRAENADENAAKVVLLRAGHAQMACESNGASSPSEAGTEAVLP